MNPFKSTFNTLLLLALFVGAIMSMRYIASLPDRKPEKVLVDDSHETNAIVITNLGSVGQSSTNPIVIYTNAPADAYVPSKQADSMIAKIDFIGKEFMKVKDLALYWHNAYYKHQAEYHGGYGLFRIGDAQPFDDGFGDSCGYTACLFSVEGNFDYQPEYPPLLTVSMPCGYVWELRWGDTVPVTDVPCPCGNPEHFIFRFQHSNGIEKFSEWAVPTNRFQPFAVEAK